MIKQYIFFLQSFGSASKSGASNKKPGMYNDEMKKITEVRHSLEFIASCLFLFSEIAQVTSAYVASGTEQLSLAPGQLILILKKNTSGWWQGELQVIIFNTIYRFYYKTSACSLKLKLITILDHHLEVTYMNMLSV